MTRQISDISNKKERYKFKITSLKPINPLNKADKFEKEALEFFEKNPQTKYYYKFSEDNKHFNFMGSLKIEKSCLQCHLHQGYKVGDIRGGIRVGVPTEFYQKELSSLEKKVYYDTIGIILVSLVVGGIIVWFIYAFYKRQEEIEQANNALEDKVKQRTTKLEKVLSHEKHLKDVLTTLAEVNELLINALTIKAILESCVKKTLRK